MKTPAQPRRRIAAEANKKPGHSTSATLNRGWDTLDPIDWNEFRTLGRRIVDDLADMLSGIDSRPVWRPVPEETSQFFRSELPVKPRDPMRVYDEVLRHVMSYPTGNIHPRFFGWVLGSNAPIAILASLIEAGIDCAPTRFDDSASRVEAQLIDWLKVALAYPASAEGLVTSGCSEAHLIALATARLYKLGPDVRTRGVVEHDVRVYGSVETHTSVIKALDLLGFGQDAFVAIPTDSEYRIDTARLEHAIDEDVSRGLRPLALVGTIGTTNTGSLDPLDKLAQIARNRDMWFHVDGAFGAWLRLLPEFETVLRGLEEADSVATDLHKWMYQPYDIGLVLVRNGRLSTQALGMEPEYLMHTHGGAMAGAYDYCGRGIQMSRGFRALKTWMSLQVHGIEVFEKAIQNNVSQARYLAHRIQSCPHLELLAPVASNIVVFRCVAAGYSPDEVDRLNGEILKTLQRSGVALPSPTELLGRYALRAAFSSHRTTLADVDILVDQLIELTRKFMPSCVS